MTTTTSPIDRLRATLADATDHPTEDRLQRLATASLLHGLLHADTLDTCVIALAQRIDRIGREAIEELTKAIARHTGQPLPDLPEDNRLPEDSTLPEVAVEYQPCPSCGHAAADQTYKLGKDSRRPVPGSPDARFTYATCNGCGLKVRVVFYSGV